MSKNYFSELIADDRGYDGFLEDVGIETCEKSERFVRDDLLGERENGYTGFLEDVGRSPDASDRFMTELQEAGSYDTDAGYQESLHSDDGDVPRIFEAIAEYILARKRRTPQYLASLRCTVAEDANDAEVFLESEDLTDGPVRLVETVQIAPRGENVDRVNGVIRGVKLLGWTSRNGRRYTRGAGRDAVRLYEGVAVNMDHGERADTPREIARQIGVIRAVREEAAGVFGDLHYITTHPYGPAIGERAERFPESFGMSHAVEAKGKRGSDGIYEVDSITKVHSIDLVSRPATTKGLFESEESMPEHERRSAFRKWFSEKCGQAAV